MISLILHGIAVWYVARLFIWERGPLNLFGRIRTLFKVKYINGYPVAQTGNELSWLFSCVICLSFWVSVAYVAVSKEPWPHILIYGGIAMLIEEVLPDD